LVRDVIIAGDADEAGESAAHIAAQKFLREGRRVRIARAPTGRDFNDMLMESDR
jgi:putative DNA primase/helicase